MPIKTGRWPLSKSACSKLKLERQLDRARSADLIDRVAEQGRGLAQVVVRVAEVWVVKDIEELSTETQPER